MKIVLTRGLPASGKSFWSKQFCEENKGWKRINKDDLRAMIDNGKWSKENEEMILKIRNNTLRSLLKGGHNVIIDDTNFEQKHIDCIEDIAKEYTAIVETKEFNTPVWTCIERDEKRTNPVGKKIIWGMYEKYVENKKEYKYFDCPDDKEKAVIFDIDGTLAHSYNRNHYDYTKVHEDYCDIYIKDILWKYKRDGYKILIVSGRTDDCKKETEQWLGDNEIAYDKIFMRKTGDSRQDAIIKKELYDYDISKNYAIFLCFDDRDQVVQMWRSLGLRCLQVNYGNF